MIPETLRPEINKPDLSTHFRTRAIEIENDVKRECAEKAFWEILLKNKETLPNFVVRLPGSYEQYGLRFGISCEENSNLYYFGEDKRLLIGDENTQTGRCPVAKTIDRPIEIVEMEQILADLEKAVQSKENQEKLIIPKGFFVFKYQAQWAAGGYDDEKITRMDVIKAKDLKEATRLLLARLDGHHENCFWNFNVNTGEEWRWLGANNGISDGEILFSSLGLERCYFYEEGLICGGEEIELKLWGDGKEFEKAIQELSRYEIPSNYRDIFNFNNICPIYKGKPVLVDWKWPKTIVGLEEIREYLKTRRAPVPREEVPVTLMLQIWARPDDQEARKLADRLLDRQEELRNAGIDLSFPSADEPLTFCMIHSSGIRVKYLDQAVREVDQIIRRLDERKE